MKVRNSNVARGVALILVACLFSGATLAVDLVLDANNSYTVDIEPGFSVNRPNGVSGPMHFSGGVYIYLPAGATGDTQFGGGGSPIGSADVSQLVNTGEVFSLVSGGTGTIYDAVLTFWARPGPPDLGTPPAGSLQPGVALSVTVAGPSDIVTVNAIEWVQPSEFAGLTWNDVNSVCPGGACNGTLAGRDVSGWRWATRSEVGNLLFSAVSPHPGGEAQYEEPDSSWAPAFFDVLGFAPTSDLGPVLRMLAGLTSDTSSGQAGIAFARDLNTQPFGDIDQAITDQLVSLTQPIEGVWLYRDPLASTAPVTHGVPVVPIGALAALACVLVGLARRV